MYVVKILRLSRIVFKMKKENSAQTNVVHLLKSPMLKRIVCGAGNHLK